MQSKIEFVYEPNGNMLEQISKGDRLYAGQVGTAEYYLRMANEDDPNNWTEDDYVFIAFQKSNGDAVNRRMNFEDGVWHCVSDGWETNFENIGTSQNIRISFICRRYSADRQFVATKTTEQCTLAVLPSVQYSYLDKVEESSAEDLLQTIHNVESRFADFQQSAILINQAKAEANTLPTGSEATVDIKRVDEKGNTLFSFGLPQGDTIKAFESGEPTIVGDKTVTPITAVRTDGERLKPVELSARNGRDGNGVFALDVENGDLVIYSEQVDSASFEITDDGYLSVVLEGGE